MATPTQRVKALADAITNTDTALQLISDVADDCIYLRPDLFNPADPENPTQDERAIVLVTMALEYFKNIRKAAYDHQQEAITKAAGQAKADELG